MRGADGSTAPYHTGTAYVLSAGLARSIFVDDRAHTAAFTMFGSVSEDANMGKLVAYAESHRGITVRKPAVRALTEFIDHDHR